MRRVLLIATAALIPWSGPAAAGEAAFAAKPRVAKQGGGHVVSFAVKNACDATVAIVDKDGKVVRHLASGVLGPNAPSPLKKNALEQSLVWDGKDDAGRPARRPCSFRVSLGLRPMLERFLTVGGNEPGIGDVTVAVVAKDGTLYLCDGCAVSAGFRVTRVMAFDRDGGYLRTVFPVPSNTPPEKLKSHEFFRIPGRAAFPGRNGMFPFSRGRQQTAVMLGGRIVFASGIDYFNTALCAFGTDGSVPEDWRGPLVAPKGHTWGRTDGPTPAHIALAPDGKTFYVSGTRDYKKAGGTDAHVVYRLTWGDKGDPKPFLGEYGVAGGDNRHFKDTRGVACDRDGNLYVADNGNNRIQVFKVDGTYLRSIQIERPHQIFVHPRTGALYVSQVGRLYPIRGKVEPNRAQALLKLSSDGKITARLELPKGLLQSDWSKAWLSPIVAPNFNVDPTVLWIVHPGEGAGPLWKVVDRGNALERVAQIAAAEQGLAFWEKAAVPFAVDATRDEVYLNLTTSRQSAVTGYGGAKGRQGCSEQVWKRFDGGTGAVEEVKFLPGDVRKGVGLATGPDGCLYTRTYGGKRHKRTHSVIRRLDREGKEVPFPAAPKGLEVPLTPQSMDGRRILLFSVGRDGRIYVPVEGESLGHRRGSEMRINVYGPGGKLLKEGYVSGLSMNSRTIGADKSGNLYVLTNLVVGGKKGVPAGLNILSGDVGKWFAGVQKSKKGGAAFGTLAAFGPDGGTFPGDLRWHHFGVSPIGLTGNCVCNGGYGDVDGFGRAFVPDTVTHTALVFDAAGNLVARFGGYGNWDSQGPKSRIPEPEIPFLRPDYVGVSDTACYVGDGVNARVVKVKLGYAAEASVPVP